MCEIELFVGSGFFIEKSTGYLIEFSENRYAWQCNPITSILTIPNFDNPLHKSVLHHEVHHAYVYQFVSKRSLLLLIWRILFSIILLNGFEELWVSYRSKTLRQFYKTDSNVVEFFYSCFIVGCFLYCIFFNFYALSILIGVLIGYAFVVGFEDV